MPSTALVLLNRPSADAPPHRPGAPALAGADPGAAAVSALDLGATRGDGVFETITVGAGRPQALEPHLRRFARSAAALDLPEPDADAWRDAIVTVARAIDPVPEAFVKTVLTRGVEGDPRPTGWAYAAPAPDATNARTLGIRVVTLDRGLRSDAAVTSPWLLAGAKTLSYAVNRAVLREAARRGADDVILLSSDGYVLEGPSSSVVIRRGNALLTPDPALGILEGTTQGSLFAFAEARGMATGVERLTPARLRDADGIWLTSSVRLAAPVRELDGEPRPVDAALTAAMNASLLARTD